MVLAWLTKRALGGVPNWMWATIALFLLVALGLFLWTRAEEADDTANQTIGRTEERAETQAVTIERAEEANAIRQEVQQPGPAGDDVRYNVCLRSARTPSSCERFLHPGPADND